MSGRRQSVRSARKRFQVNTFAPGGTINDPLNIEVEINSTSDKVFGEELNGKPPPQKKKKFEHDQVSPMKHVSFLGGILEILKKGASVDRKLPRSGHADFYDVCHIIVNRVAAEAEDSAADAEASGLHSRLASLDQNLGIASASPLKY
ncbi:unnamed protein product [Caenorhabditis angaria]|uniref:Uncharacterized protein n=1 Tax=Caenorhabditis angaria TaxID=860376 RepID=A0A9P1MYB3_9PELO|nr:unnamed protein product [Caenorhabditis angaria]